MELFGLTPFVAAIIITIAGVAGSVVLGWLKGNDPFNPRQVAASAIIAFVISIQIVSAQISAIPDGIAEHELGAIVFALIAQVSGIDSLAKSGAQAAMKTLKKKS